jgi:competence protein ComEC
LSISLQWNLNPILFLGISGIGILGLHVLNRKRAENTGKTAFLVFSDVFLFLSGLYCVYATNIKNNERFYGHFISEAKQEWIGEIKDLPQEKENFYKVKVDVIETANRNTTGEIIAYIRKPFDASLLKPGNRFFTRSFFNPIQSPLNPHEFNYREFLERKNIHHQCFINAEEIVFIETNRSFSLRQAGLSIKKEIIERFRNGELEENAANLCVAMLTGYDEDFSREEINAFAHSGTLHVLSVSGLHTGLLYALLVFILGIFDPHRNYKILQTVIIITTLFLLVVITGFSAPVLRASIMLSLLVIGRTFFNYSGRNSLNILAVSAFLILVFEPFLLFDTGFLLSYLAVTGIICFAPYFSDLFKTRNFVLKKAGDLISISLAAQITTLPLTLYLFHQFPLWFIFSNLLIIPLCTIVMFLGLLFIFKMSFLSSPINFLVKTIYFFIHLTDNNRLGYIDQIHFDLRDALFMSLVILLLTALISTRSFRYALTGGLIIICWQFNSILESYDVKRRSEIGIYHLNKNFSADLKNRTLLIHDSNADTANYDYHVKPNHTFQNYHDQVNAGFEYVKKKDFSFFHLKSKNRTPLAKRLSAKYLLISNSVEVDESLLQQFHPQMVILDGTNTFSYLSKMKEMCRKFEIGFHATKEQGYLSLKTDQ